MNRRNASTLSWGCSQGDHLGHIKQSRILNDHFSVEIVLAADFLKSVLMAAAGFGELFLKKVFVYFPQLLACTGR